MWIIHHNAILVGDRLITVDDEVIQTLVAGLADPKFVAAAS